VSSERADERIIFTDNVHELKLLYAIEMAVDFSKVCGILIQLLLERPQERGLASAIRANEIE
jgi:hypothetical protein